MLAPKQKPLARFHDEVGILAKVRDERRGRSMHQKKLIAVSVLVPTKLVRVIFAGSGKVHSLAEMDRMKGGLEEIGAEPAADEQVVVIVNVQVHIEIARVKFRAISLENKG